MSKMLQVRNIPDDLHRVLKVRAAAAGQSLSDFVTAELRLIAERPTLDELRARIASRRPVRTRISPAEIIREERDSR